MSGVTFRPASEVKRVADKLIPKHHEDLVDVDVRYVFRSEHAKSSGKAVFGRAKKISGLNAYLAQLDEPDEVGVEGNDGDFFVIEIAEDLWGELSSAQRTALVDHELCHCAVTYDKDENLKLVTRPHDLEEFRSVVERHGLWMPDVAKMAESMQLRLAVGAPSPVDEAVQDLIDAVPDGMKMTVSTSGGRSAVVADKTDHLSNAGSERPSDAEPQNDEALGELNGGVAGETSLETPGMKGEEQEQAVVDTSASTDAEEGSRPNVSPPSGEPDAEASAPLPSSPAQRLALGRHIANLDDGLTSEFLTWCKNTKTPENPQHMSFEQARKALILVGDSARASAP